MKLPVHLPRRLTWALSGLALLALSGCQTMLPWAAAKEPAPAKEAAPAKAAAKPETPGMIAPLVEKRETLTATGYAVISVQNHRNPAQQRLLAIRASKLDAYRALTEQVYGQQLDATTTVADMTVQSDTFRARVEGVIYGAVLVSITPAGDDTYETTLSLDKAVVQDLRALYLGQVQARAR
jgi:outer membrane protein FlgP